MFYGTTKTEGRIYFEMIWGYCKNQLLVQHVWVPLLLCLYIVENKQVLLYLEHIRSHSKIRSGSEVQLDQ